MKISFFIDQQGRRISSEKIINQKEINHIVLADFIVKNDQEMKAEYLQSRRRSTIEFLMEDKRYMAGVEENEKNRKEIVYNSKLISEIQRICIQNYQDKGYNLLDLAELRRKSQTRNLERGED